MNITEFQKSRFGLLSIGESIPSARGEWVRSTGRNERRDYIPFANEFDQDLFDPHNGLNWQKSRI